MRKVIIIGRNSNLTNQLSSKFLDCNILSSREILSSSKILNELKEQVNINIIFNNFQTAINLNKFDNLESYISNSIISTSRILDFFNKNHIKINKIIYTSSSSVYGNNILCNEKDELKPMNLHASLKVANEKLIEKFCLDNNIDYTIARIFNMYGGDDNFSIISKIIQAYKDNNELTIVNNGNSIRDFIHIEDVVDIYLKILELKNVNILNIGTGEGNSVKNILDYLKNNNINLKLKNINRSELKISTADTQYLNSLFCEIKFRQINDYLKKELNI